MPPRATRFSQTGISLAVRATPRVYGPLTGREGMLIDDYVALLRSLNIDPVITSLGRCQHHLWCAFFVRSEVAIEDNPPEIPG